MSRTPRRLDDCADLLVERTGARAADQSSPLSETEVEIVSVLLGFLSDLDRDAKQLVKDPAVVNTTQK